MEEKKFDIIKAGTRVHEKDKPKHVGTVVMQAETTGKCLVKLDEYSTEAHTAGGLFKEPRAIWREADALVVDKESAAEFVPDLRKNWAVSLHCIDGKISYVMRYESGRFTHGWLNKQNLTPTEAVREWAEGEDDNPTYTKLIGETAPEKKDPAGELVEGKAVYINGDAKEGASGFTYGKVYEFHNGRCINDRGYISLEYRERGFAFKTNFVLIEE